MKEKDAELLATAMTECYASNRGCKRLPVRAIVEIPVNDPDGVDAEIVMMCIDHSATYNPRGKVIDDRMLVNDKNLKMMQEIGA